MLLELNEVKTPGTLITFCGLDGCGKTTMIRRLAEDLINLGVDVELTKQPTDLIRKDPLFRKFQDTPMQDTGNYRSLSLLCASDRLHHSNQVILPMLNEGKTVISDRYFYSCVANLMARGYKSDKWIYEIAKYIPRPNLTFFLDCDVNVAISRVRQREDEKNNYINEAFQQKLRSQYIQIAAQTGGIVIKTNDHEEETYQRIKKIVVGYMNKKYNLHERSFANV